jgi:polysaccharide chain length determinant protein (PEP-CTERM system associated)
LPDLEDQNSLNLNESIAGALGFLTRRRWWILIPFFSIALATIAVLMVLPNRYTSTATLLVVEQQIPQRYVVPNSETDVTAALEAMKQQVLSRTQLLRMINDFGLYPKKRARLAPEELVGLMSSNIKVEPTNESPRANNSKGFDAFRISFTTENAILAQQVTNTLTSLFINEYLRTGAEQATNTTNFLHQQVEEKGKLLQVQEDRLRDFKLQHVGELPEQQTGNLGILTGLQNQLTNTMLSLERAQQQRAFLQAQLDGMPKRRATTEFSLASSGTPDKKTITPLEAAQNELVLLENTRSSLLSKGYTSQHPDIIRNQQDIARAEENVRRQRAIAVSSEKPPAEHPFTSRSTAQDPADDLAVAQLKSSLEANRVEIENLTNNEKRLKTEVAQYEGRLNQTPVREQQQAGILRETEVLRQQYADLQKKEQESQLATNLERQQGGQQFRLVDPASLPSVPSSPNRIKTSMGGIVGGLVLGFALALLTELIDTSFYTEKDFIKHFAPPFVLSVPQLPTRAEESRRKWQNVLQWAVALTMLIVVGAAEVYVTRMR